MTNRIVRIALLMVALGAVGGAAYRIVRFEQQKAVRTAEHRVIEDEARGLSVLIADIRAAEQSYVAAGQGYPFWIARVQSMLSRADDRLSSLRAAARTDAGRTALDQAAAALDTFRKLDARAGEYVRADQRLLASDLIFTDGAEVTATAATRIDGAREIEQEARDVSLSAVRKQELLSIIGATAITLFVLMALVPIGRVAPRPIVDATGHAPVDTEGDLELAPRSEQLAGPAPVPVPTPNEASLAAAAELCTEFGRVLETRELTPLLARAAALLDAAGIILWVADRSGAELCPTLAHGYPSEVLGRMSALPRDAHNATAAAYRTAQVRTVPRNDSSNGAIVAPLITPAGCLGVIAAEVRNGSEASGTTRALARIFAAQLATLVSSVPATPTVAQAQG